MPVPKLGPGRCDGNIGGDPCTAFPREGRSKGVSPFGSLQIIPRARACGPFPFPFLVLEKVMTPRKGKEFQKAVQTAALVDALTDPRSAMVGRLAELANKVQ